MRYTLCCSRGRSRQHQSDLPCYITKFIFLRFLTEWRSRPLSYKKWHLTHILKDIRHDIPSSCPVSANSHIVYTDYFQRSCSWDTEICNYTCKIASFVDGRPNAKQNAYPRETHRIRKTCDIFLKVYIMWKEKDEKDIHFIMLTERISVYWSIASARSSTFRWFLNQPSNFAAWKNGFFILSSDYLVIFPLHFTDLCLLPSI